MKAIRCHAYDGVDALRCDDVAPPALGKHDVMVEVHAAGVNFADVLMVEGKYQVKPPLPFTAGQEFAGIVAEVGAKVSRVSVGQRVMGVVMGGAFAEYAVTSEATVFPIPEAMSFVQAAGFPIAYGTSHVALTHRGRLQAGETLLVHGAAGGVGLTAVEIGRALGATVIATASSAEKLARAAKHGAHHGINYREANFKDEVKALTKGRGADVIYDPVGGDVFDLSLRCIAWEGRLLTIGYASGRIPSAPANRLLIKNCAVVGVFWGAYLMRNPAVIARSFSDLFARFEQGQLSPFVGATFPLEQAREALGVLAARKAIGKVILTTAAHG